MNDPIHIRSMEKERDEGWTHCTTTSLLHNLYQRLFVLVGTY